MHTEAIDPPGLVWRRVSPRYVTVRLVGWALANLAAVAVLSLPLVLVLNGAWGWPPLWIAAAVPAAAFLLALWRLVLIPRQVRSIGYAEREDDLLIRRGIFFQRVLVVPYGRMQYVDIGAGPVERGLGLCTLKLHTASAGTSAEIPGLPAGEGARLREQLSARGEARLAGL
jgi:membrane protein YdbS with pleckstrin-like domain